MKARVLTLLLAATPAKAKAEPLKLALQHTRRPIAGAATTGLSITATDRRREVAPRRQVDAETVRRVLAVRVTATADEVSPARRTLELPPSMFEREQPIERARRRISVRPASFQPQGSGIKVKIPF